MKRFHIIAVLLLAVTVTVGAQNYRKKVKPVKNVILMIPDGTSIGVVSAARWYKIYNNIGTGLNIDPYMCGTVKTFSSNAPIGDSAPATSCYMTGVPQQTGNIAIYPPADPDNDLVPVDSAKAYQPLATILEASRIEKNKSTGLVVTVEFPHATPADCSAHHYKRSKYDYLSSQMVYQNLDVMFGGGNKLITTDMKNHFERNGTSYIKNDVSMFRKHDKGKVWALFADMDLPCDLDQTTDTIPSLKEMTTKAIELLSQNENGFFLMVEGSKVDWSAHGNDAVGCITEFIAFDDAIGAALDFAKKDGNTAIVVLPDHGNSGFTIGRKDLKRYDKASITKLFDNVSKYTKTAEGLEKILLKEDSSNFKAILKKYNDIEITDEELAKLIESKNFKHDDYMKIGYNPNMIATLVEIMNSRTYFGFTTGGHTGEEVFLAAYHPDGDIPIGMNTNVEINQYLSDLSGLAKGELNSLTDKLFAKHTDILKNYKYSIEEDKETKFPVLVIRKGKKKLRVPAFKSVAYLDKKIINLGSVTVYIDKNNTFYIPRNIVDYLN